MLKRRQQQQTDLCDEHLSVCIFSHLSEGLREARKAFCDAYDLHAMLNEQHETK